MEEQAQVVKPNEQLPNYRRHGDSKQENIIPTSLCAAVQGSERLDPGLRHESGVNHTARDSQ